VLAVVTALPYARQVSATLSGFKTRAELASWAVLLPVLLKTSASTRFHLFLPDFRVVSKSCDLTTDQAVVLSM
jgi:hypothetical protein